LNLKGAETLLGLQVFSAQKLAANRRTYIHKKKIILVEKALHKFTFIGKNLYKRTIPGMVLTFNHVSARGSLASIAFVGLPPLQPPIANRTW